VLDIPAEDAYATAVALTDNTTSMYTSVGGGTIGAGEHPRVAQATHRLLSLVQDHLGSFGGDDDGRLPPAGHVRDHLLTPSGNRYVDVPEDGFWGRAEHEFMPVIAASQDLLSAIREVSSPRRRTEGAIRAMAREPEIRPMVSLGEYEIDARRLGAPKGAETAKTKAAAALRRTIAEPRGIDPLPASGWRLLGGDDDQALFGT